MGWEDGQGLVVGGQLLLRGEGGSSEAGLGGRSGRGDGGEGMSVF